MKKGTKLSHEIQEEAKRLYVVLLRFHVRVSEAVVGDLCRRWSWDSYHRCVSLPAQLLQERKRDYVCIHEQHCSMCLFLCGKMFVNRILHARYNKKFFTFNLSLFLFLICLDQYFFLTKFFFKFNN